MPSDQETLLTASVLENAIANNGDLWGLLQPYAHLNAGRTATGNLPRGLLRIHIVFIVIFYLFKANQFQLFFGFIIRCVVVAEVAVTIRVG